MKQCPSCQQNLRRIRRKPSDRTLSYILPVQRYLCLNHDCRWQGLRVVWSAHPLLKKSEQQTKKAS